MEALLDSHVLHELNAPLRGDGLFVEPGSIVTGWNIHISEVDSSWLFVHGDRFKELPLVDGFLDLVDLFYDVFVLASSQFVGHFEGISSLIKLGDHEVGLPLTVVGLREVGVHLDGRVGVLDGESVVFHLDVAECSVRE